MGYGSLAISWILFGTLHSVTASLWFKHWVITIIGLPKSYYRLAYTGFSLTTFLPVLFTLRAAPIDPLFTNWDGSLWVGGLLISAGVLIGLLSFKQYDLAEFIGWPVRHQSAADGSFRQDGLLRLVRHPLYLGILLILIGLLIYQPNWKHLLFDLLAFAYLRIGIHFEEQKLIREFGSQYIQYRQRVPMLIPTF